MKGHEKYQIGQPIQIKFYLIGERTVVPVMKIVAPRGWLVLYETNKPEIVEKQCKAIKAFMAATLSVSQSV